MSDEISHITVNGKRIEAFDISLDCRLTEKTDPDFGRRLKQAMKEVITQKIITSLQTENLANDLLATTLKPEDEQWTGFTAVLARYSDANGAYPTVSREVADNLFSQVAKQKPPVTLNGERFRLKSARLVEETPTTGYVEVEYVREHDL